MRRILVNSLGEIMNVVSRESGRIKMELIHDRTFDEMFLSIKSLWDELGICRTLFQAS